MRYLLAIFVVMAFAAPAVADVMIIDDDDGSYSGYAPDPTPYEAACTNIGLTYTTWNTTSSGDPGAGDMASYDAVFWITGSTSNLEPGDPIPTALVSYFGTDGQVFVEGGEVGYDCLQNDSSDPLGTAMGVEDWDTDGSVNDGTLVCLDTSNDLFTTPNAITTPLNYTRTDYGDIDGMDYMSGTDALLLVGGYSQPGHECMSVLDDGGYSGITLTVATGGVTDQANLTALVENIIDYMGLTPVGIKSASLGEIKAAFK